MNFKKDLIDNIIPFWLDNAIDKENGGIFTQLDEKGNIYGTEKSVWFQGRALWTFSKAYNLIEKNPKYLEAAKTIYEFLPKCEDNDGRMFFTVTKEGLELQKRRYYFSETFAAIGCAEYYKACGEKKVMEDAEKYFDTAYKCYTGEIKTEPKIKNLDTKALSPVMIMLSTAQVLRSLKNENYDKYNISSTTLTRYNAQIKGKMLKYRDKEITIYDGTYQPSYGAKGYARKKGFTVRLNIKDTYGYTDLDYRLGPQGDDFIGDFGRRRATIKSLADRINKIIDDAK